jgi:hypothetical protein
MKDLDIKILEKQRRQAMTVELKLSVNGAKIDTDYFVSGFIDHTVSGMIESLEDTSPVKDLKLSVDGDKVTINLNGSIVPINAFVNKIMKGTILGMVSVLKGVKDAKTVNLALRK